MKRRISLIVLAALAVILVLIPILAPWIAPHDPTETNYSNLLGSPSAEYPLGTDQVGRCILSRLIYGGRTSLLIVFLVVFLSAAAGLLIGVAAGYFGGWVDQLLTGFTNAMMSMPQMVFVIAFVGFLGTGVVNTVIALVITGWFSYALLARTLVRSMCAQPFMAEAKLSGAGFFAQMREYILPNLMPHLIVLLTQDIGETLLTLAGLSLLGLASQPPTPEWGTMLSEGKKYMQTAPWMIIFPGATIVLHVIVFSLLGDQLGEVLEPDKGSQAAHKKKRRKYTMKNRILALLLALVMLCAFTGAASAEEESSEKHINAALYWFGTNFDPTCEYNGWTVMRAGVGETLVTINADLEIVGQIADSWEMVDDTTWTFHIREGVTFHNGETCDAEAVKASFERALEQNDRAYNSTYIDTITVDGEYITFTTTQTNTSFLNAISEPLFIIEYVADDVDYENAPICTGPFMVTEFEVDVKIELEAYADYWDGASDVATITVLNIEDDSTRAMALQSGEVDIVQRIASSDLPLFTDDDSYIVVDTAGIRTRTLFFNFNNETLADVNVRKALVACLDYEALAAVMGNNVTVTCAPYPLDIYGYSEIELQTYDVELAAELLAESGYEDTDGDGYVEKDGEILELTITYSTTATTALHEAIQDMAKQVGIKINLNLVESLDDIEISGDFEIRERNVQYLSTGDPAWMLTAMFLTGASSNYGDYSNEELDELINQISACVDQDEKAELVKQAQEIIIEDAAAIFMVSQTNIVAAKSTVSGITAHPIDYYFIDNKLTIEE